MLFTLNKEQKEKKFKIFPTHFRLSVYTNWSCKNGLDWPTSACKNIIKS